jgi:predicted NBD/HSP70 family sugar kinase
MVRQLTDRRVFEQLLSGDGLTRAAVAARTGISKPTVSESVRRLVDADLVAEGGPVENGVRAGLRGRVGTELRLRADTAAALAVSVGPDGVVADTYDLLDAPVRHARRDVPTPVDGRELAPILLAAVQAVVGGTPGAVRSCVVSVAGPVDRRTGRLIPLAHAPFLVGEFSASDVLRGVAPVVEVDNDVNWAALAEHRHGHATDLEDFVLCYLGAGIGGAVVVEGTVLRGAAGLAGELAHVRTAADGRQSQTLMECFATDDLFEPGTEAIDVARVRRVLRGESAADRRQGDRIAAAVAGVLDSVVAVLDPQGVLVGGPWGISPGLVERIAERMASLAGRELVLRAAGLTDAPYRDGVRYRAVAAARQAVADDF